MLLGKTINCIVLVGEIKCKLDLQSFSFLNEEGERREMSERTNLQPHSEDPQNKVVCVCERENVDMFVIL